MNVLSVKKQNRWKSNLKNPIKYKWMLENKEFKCGFIYECVHDGKQLLTRVFPSLIPLDETDNQEDQDEQSDGTHEAYEPSLSGNVHLSARHSWPVEERNT